MQFLLQSPSISLSASIYCKISFLCWCKLNIHISIQFISTFYFITFDTFHSVVHCIRRRNVICFDWKCDQLILLCSVGAFLCVHWIGGMPNMSCECIVAHKECLIAFLLLDVWEWWQFSCANRMHGVRLHARSIAYLPQRSGTWHAKCLKYYASLHSLFECLLRATLRERERENCLYVRRMESMFGESFLECFKIALREQTRVFFSHRRRLRRLALLFEMTGTLQTNTWNV